MADLLTLDEAKMHLRVTGTDQDADITLKMQEASAIIIDYLTDRADDSWDAITVPGPVKAAVCLMLAHLYEHRGDDPDSDEHLWAAIGRLLARLRCPTVA